MQCSEPGTIRDEELVAYLAGETVRPAVIEHLTHCQRCTLQLATYRQVEFELLSKLYRWDCPPNQLLGEYQMGMLSQEQGLTVKKHLHTCMLCSAEVATLTEFLANDSIVTQPGAQKAAVSSTATNSHHTAQKVKWTLDSLRNQLPDGGGIDSAHRIVAMLLPQQPRLAYQRNAGSQSVLWPRRYGAEDVTISVQVEPDGSRKDTVQLIGFVTQKGMTVEALQGHAVQLSRIGTNEETVSTQTIDELGNFVFSALLPASYTLELHLPEGTVVVDQLAITLSE